MGQENLIVYRASAGSGKTHTITGEFLKLSLEHPYSAYREIQAVTFTNLATAEMRHRFIEELHKLRCGSGEGRSAFYDELKRQYPDLEDRANIALRSILFDYEGLRVKTIDSFFQDIVRSLAIELKQHPSSRIELSHQQILKLAVELLFSEPPEVAQEAMKQFIREEEDQSFSSLKRSITTFGFHLFNEKLQQLQQHDRWFDSDSLKQFQKALSRAITDLKEEIETKVHHITQKAIPLVDDGYIKKNCKVINILRGGIDKDGIKREIGVGSRGLVTEATISQQHSTPISIDDIASKKGKESMTVAIEEVVQDVSSILDLLGSPLSTLSICQKHIYELLLIDELKKKVDQVTAELNVTLLDDTKILINTLVQGKDAPFIYERLGAKIRHHMIDEFQDTSQIQYENFKPLLDEALSTDEANFIVGDVKQSIYRFRNSDPELLHHTLQRDFPDNIDIRQLEDNWRSAPAIVTFNNAFFSTLSSGLEGTERYADITELLQRPNTMFAEVFGDPIQVEQHIPDSHLSMVGGVYLHQFEYHTPDSLPEKSKDYRLSAKIDYLLTTAIPEVLRRGYKLSDIAVLSTKNRYLQQIADAIVQHNLQHPDAAIAFISQELLSLSANPIYRLVINILQSLASSTRFHTALAQHHLLLMREMRGLSSPFDISAWYSDLIVHTSYSPLYEIVSYVIDRLGADAADVIAPEDAPYITSLLDIVHDYSQSNYVDLSGFLDWLETHESSMILTVSHQDAIELQTIHKAKGLGYPIVFLLEYDLNILDATRDIIWCRTDHIATLQSRIETDIPTLLPIKPTKDAMNSDFRDELTKEQNRALLDRINAIYVAMTRAKHEMHLLFDPEGKAFEALIAHQARRSTSSPLLICETIERIEQGEEGSPEPSLTITTDRLTFSAMQPSLATESQSASESLVKFSHPTRIDSNIKTLTLPIDTWHTPSFRVREMSSTSYRQRDAVAWGLFVHRLLSEIDYLDSREQLLRLLQVKQREGFIKPADIPALADLIYAALSDELIREYYTPHTRWSILNERRIFSGSHIQRPDRVVYQREQSVAIIIDYKTGDEALDSLSKHRRQINSYREILHKCGFAEVRAYLLYLNSGGHRVESV